MLRVVAVMSVVSLAVGFTGCELFDVIGNIGDPGTCDVYSERDCNICGQACSDAAQSDTEIGSDADCRDDIPDGGFAPDLIPTDESAGVDVAANLDPVTGFEIRKPLLREIDDGILVEDVDYVCTLAFGETDAFFYIQATPFKCSATALCQFQTVGAWISDGGIVQPVDAIYNWGGHHHNDWILIRMKGYSIRYNHSSFGFGWRSCQPPDCLQFEVDGRLEQDGCEPERTLPVVCSQVWSDGTYEPLEDDFITCPGDVWSDGSGGHNDEPDDDQDEDQDDDDQGDDDSDKYQGDNASGRDD